MDDPAFPDSHYTATTTTTTSTTTVQMAPVTLDKGYVMSVPGILRIVQIVATFLYWILLASCGYWVGFPLFVGVTSWITTIALFVIFLLQLHKRVTVINWVLTELLHDVWWVVFHFIAACIVADRAAKFSFYGYYYNHGCLSFTAVVAFACFVLYGVTAFFTFRAFQAGGGLSQLTGRSGAAGGGSATTTNVTTTEYSTEKGDDMPPPYPNP